MIKLSAILRRSNLRSSGQRVISIRSAVDKPSLDASRESHHAFGRAGMRSLYATTIVATLLAVSVHAAEFMGVAIAPEEKSETYDRSDWKHWTDADNDRIKTRDEVLSSESLATVAIDGGKVRSGLWAGPYTGLVSDNTRDFQIDHMVPLKEAHESGGHAWDAAEKEAYANDLSNPQHLIAVKGGSNGSKGAKDPAEWMPPNRAYWCTYLNDWVEIKRRWTLTMDQAEADAISNGLKVCDKYKSGDHLHGRH